MSKKQSNDIKTYWNNRALQDISEQEITHKDIWQRWLEIEIIKKELTSDSRVLEAGCGNGYTSYQIKALVKELIGFDYSENMIKVAKKLNPELQFEIFDVLDLSPDVFGIFNVVISERCLVNIPNWENQKKALKNIANVIKPGGKLIFLEGWKEGRENLNNLRQKLNLKSMPSVWHNLDFSWNRTIPYLEQFFKIEKKLHQGTYDFISRVVHPLFVHPEEPYYHSKLNEIAAKISLVQLGYESISRGLFLILKKKQKEY